MARLAARSSLREHLGGALVQLLDGGKPRQSEGFARDHDRQRQRGGDGKRQRDVTHGLAAREQILDQVDNAEPEAEQHQPARRGPEQRAPAEAAPGRDQRRCRSAPATAQGRAPA